VYLLLVVLVFAGTDVGFLLDDGMGAGVGSGCGKLGPWHLPPMQVMRYVWRDSRAAGAWGFVSALTLGEWGCAYGVADC
jgi:hypothetical protein